MATYDPRISKLYALLTEGRHVRLQKDQEFQSSDGNLQMGLVTKGYVKRYTIRNDGSLSIQSIYGPGHVFPLTIAYKLLLHQDIYSGPETIHYSAITPAVICSLDNDSFEVAVAKDPTIYKELFFVSGRRTHSNIQRLENVSLLVYYNRVAHQLLYLAEQFGKVEGSHTVIDVPLTQQDIADILSATRETVSLCITKLKQKKLIKSGVNKKIIVTNMEQLKAEAYA